MTSMTITQATILMALLSALARAGLNVIDRHQIGINNISIRTINFWNNVIPGIILTAASIAVAGSEFLAALFDWRTMLFAALAQGVAYAFSYGFRNLTVNQVTVAAKFSDLVIPLGLFLTTGDWSWHSYWFSVATTLVCIPILWVGNAARTGSILVVGMVLCVALVAQASLSPLLTSTLDDYDSGKFLAFTTAVIVWRALWSLAPAFHLARSQDFWHTRLLASPAFILRCILTIATQVSFVAVMTSPASAVAWPILNSTGLLAMLISASVLKDQQPANERIIIALIFVLSVFRFSSQ
ncbi:hypothetical protein [Cupriavidus sp. AcVe19-1a]|uniref:hypothetical protein n=1 Tax=Cupriavidus sp. AcVe19-1a TaxID=2821359 RepID=UPI001AE92D31|nr:hypothetical protein [Cupriavidus sp. AcVe19-1a]MBP0631061.1 hypothetical protein [Cupriavidus sp. AcVe19-1a]